MKEVLIILIILITACKSPQKGLELTVLNKDFVAYCPKEECIDSERFLEDDIYNKEVNILHFKIENKSDQTYFFMPIGKMGKMGNVPYKSFPKSLSGLSLRNLAITNSKGEIMKYGGHSTHSSEYEIKTDSLRALYYEKMNYELNYNRELSQNVFLILPAGETVFYESNFTLPLNETSSEYSQEFYKLDKKETYTASLIFAGEKELVEKRLTNAQKETIKHNNYKIFDGELISTNSVPIIFKD